MHLLLVVITFIFFGLGLEGKRSLGHEFLQVLLQPGAYLHGPWIIILLMNSFLWGFCSAMLIQVLHRMFAKS